MSFFRSQTVSRFKLYLPRQSAWNVINLLGEKQLIHVIPSKSQQIIRQFTFKTKLIQECLQKINRLEGVLIQRQMSHPLKNINKDDTVQIYRMLGQFQLDTSNPNQVNKVNLVIESVDQLWQFYIQINKRIQMLQKQMKISRQKIAVLLAGQRQYGKSFFYNQKSTQKSYDKPSLGSTNKINFKSGVIHISNQLKLKRTVFRITKGNCLVMTKNFQELFSDLSDSQKLQTVFFVIYPANKQTYFDKKLTKLISNFCDKNYDYSFTGKNSFQYKINQLKNIYFQAFNLKKMCESQLQLFLAEKLLGEHNELSGSKLKLWRYTHLKLYLIKQKQIYQSLNQMEIYDHFFEAQVFIRKKHIQEVQSILNCSGDNQIPPGNITPILSQQKLPSSFELNDYTTPAQEIVQTYGVPNYKQINPSFFTTITFPFLFGVMFGDIGHGLILLLLGGLLVLKTQQVKKLNNSILQLLLPYRYLITLMGFFATFCGFIYNDFLSISLDIFGSCYSLNGINQGQEMSRMSASCVYPIGLDPAWSVAQNSLNFTNSLKMKISVIIGVIHMTLGVVLRALNDRYFRNTKQLIFVFIPQLVFMLVLFGYMDFIIVYKWLVPWGTQRDLSTAPSIINQMISIPLALGSTEGKPLWDKSSQQTLQYFLLVLAAVAIPMMFFPVPLMKILKYRSRRNPSKSKNKPKSNKYIDQKMQNQINEILYVKQHQLEENQQSPAPSIVQEEQSPSQIFVHQTIQTIQYVLGCVSNTASYLRLWALSLAHSQLSEVFFQKTVQSSIQAGWTGIFMNIVGFFFLACITIGIMLLMDTMECFLHTLRLHWVQFQNKFYKGNGFSFKNFSFRDKFNDQLKKTTPDTNDYFKKQPADTKQSKIST